MARPLKGRRSKLVAVYKFEVTLQDNAAAQGLDATQTLTWEARNQ
jgi:hypothetical protein